MKRILGENDLIWEIMADLANRQLGGNQVVAIHLERGVRIKLLPYTNFYLEVYAAK